jgi:monoamine oxidase
MGGVIDYAVVGGGVAGTYVAWRLATGPGSRTVHLFEATSRVGGRLLTGQMPGLPFRVELGGMRYTDRQLLLAKLIKILNLSCRPFEFETCLLFLRGCHVTPTLASPYKLGIGEISKSPGELILHTLRTTTHSCHPRLRAARPSVAAEKDAAPRKKRYASSDHLMAARIVAVRNTKLRHQ